MYHCLREAQDGKQFYKPSGTPILKSFGMFPPPPGDFLMPKR
jgi:hypothetical protein